MVYLITKYAKAGPEDGHYPTADEADAMPSLVGAQD